LRLRLVSGAGEIKLTKDGNVLLHEMVRSLIPLSSPRITLFNLPAHAHVHLSPRHPFDSASAQQIQHPTAALIARTATAQDDITGDGTTSNVLFTGELMKQCERYLSEGLHPRILVEGLELARDKALTFLDTFKTDASDPSRDLLIRVARTSLRTKVHTELADLLTEIVTDAVLCIRQPQQPVDLHMVEMMYMEHKNDVDSRLIKGLVLDHGARHPDMARRSENCFILTLNVSLEYEKTEVNSGIFWKDAAERERMVAAERKHTDDKVRRFCGGKFFYSCFLSLVSCFLILDSCFVTLSVPSCRRLPISSACVICLLEPTRRLASACRFLRLTRSPFLSFFFRRPGRQDHRAQEEGVRRRQRQRGLCGHQPEGH
jgi:T-complex protein 1 subunit zeta